MEAIKPRKIYNISYKNEYGDIREEILLDLMSGIEGDITELHYFLDSLNHVMSCCYSMDYMKILNLLAEKQPYVEFGAVYYAIKSYTNTVLCEKDLKYLKKYIDKHINVFMLVNYSVERILNKDEVIALEYGI